MEKRNETVLLQLPEFLQALWRGFFSYFLLYLFINVFFVFIFFFCGGNGAYPDAKSGDLQNALDGEHPGEAYVTVLQCGFVHLALPVVLQCTHWQTHGRQQTYIRTYKPKCLTDFFNSLFCFYCSSFTIKAIDHCR